MENKLPTGREELTQAAIKGVVSAIPVVGGLIAELGCHLMSPLDKRKRAWSEEVESALDELAIRYGRFPEALVEDSAFVSVFLKATATALATHKKKKIKALRDFVVAVGSRAIPDEELQHVLLKLLEDLSIGHIEVLLFLEDNYGELKKKEQLESIFGIYRYRHEGELDRMAFRWILSDLESRMVIHLGDIKDMNEFASRKDTLLSESSKLRFFQITKLGRHLLQVLGK